MTREALKTYLTNTPLVRAIEQKMEIDQTKRELANTLSLLGDLRMKDSAAYGEIEQKLREYQNISKHYGFLLQDAFDVTWQKESVIGKYLDYADGVDSLPERITA